ncbi:MAG: response regulator [Alphaproteobacteria bacterium]|nr:response regulator [Alphaproteobacteria bacterium]
MSDLVVLLVDDNEHMLLLLTEALKAFGIRNVLAETDAKRALSTLALRKIDIVLTDLAMEPVNGIEFAREVRRSIAVRNPKIPMIMVTGHTEQDLIREAMEAGINQFLAKPIAPKTLHDRIISVLDGSAKLAKTEPSAASSSSQGRDPSAQFAAAQRMS